MFSESATNACDIFVQLHAHILVYKPNLMSADETHPPRLAKEERLAVSVISVFTAPDLYLRAMLQI